MQKSDYLGQFQTSPKLYWDLEDYSALKLQWFQIERFGEYAGEVLAGFELFRDDDGSGAPYAPAMSNRYWLIPANISPNHEKFRVQVDRAVYLA